MSAPESEARAQGARADSLWTLNLLSTGVKQTATIDRRLMHQIAIDDKPSDLAQVIMSPSIR
jgi:hypothetical protein